MTRKNVVVEARRKLLEDLKKSLGASIAGAGDLKISCFLAEKLIGFYSIGFPMAVDFGTSCAYHFSMGYNGCLNLAIRERRIPKPDDYVQDSFGVGTSNSVVDGWNIAVNDLQRKYARLFKGS